MRLLNTSVNHSLAVQPPPGLAIPPSDFRQLQIEEGLARLCEEMLLFGEVSFHIAGPNEALALLVSRLGVKAVESLLSSGVIGFIHNPSKLLIPRKTHNVQPPLLSATWTEAEYNDPEASLSAGLGVYAPDISGKVKANLIKKARDRYSTPDAKLVGGAANIVLGAYNNGLFEPFGLPAKDYKDISFAEREQLSYVGEDMFEVGIMTQFGLGSLNRPRNAQLFAATFDLVAKARNIQSNFEEIARIEDIPDFHSLIINEQLSIQEAIRISQSSAGREFQIWLDGITTSPTSPAEARRRYLDSIESKNSFFSTGKGKVVKALGAQGLTAFALLAAASPLEARLIEGGLSILLEFANDALFRGYNPRVFMDRELRGKIEAPGEDGS